MIHHPEKWQLAFQWLGGVGSSARGGRYLQSSDETEPSGSRLMQRPAERRVVVADDSHVLTGHLRKGCVHAGNAKSDVARDNQCAARGIAENAKVRRRVHRR